MTDDHPDDLAGQTIALVGGAGFIGHNLALELADRGAEVHVIDSLQVNNLLTYSAKMPDLYNRDLYLKIIHRRIDLMHDAGVELHVQDARDYHMLSHTLNDQVDPDIIVHLAAVAHAGKSNKDPYSTFDHSLRTLENALDCARGHDPHFIYLSSSMVYGDFRAPEVTEEHPLEPKGIYGALKLSGEKLVIAYNQVFDLPYTIIRPSALYGPRCVSRRVGQVFIENALDGAKLRVDGDGTDRLDFTYIEDLVEGLCLVMTEPEAKGQTFNMTYGEARTINDLVAVMKKHFPDIEVEYAPRDELMPERGTLSVAKAKKLLGYDPSYPLEVGFDEYIQWYRKITGGEGA